MRCILLKFIPATSIAFLAAIHPCVGAAEVIGGSRMKLQQGQEVEVLKVQVKHAELPARVESGVPPSRARATPVATTASAADDEPAGQTRGTWLAALVLMAAIAIRRQRS